MKPRSLRGLLDLDVAHPRELRAADVHRGAARPDPHPQAACAGAGPARAADPEDIGGRARRASPVASIATCVHPRSASQSFGANSPRVVGRLEAKAVSALRASSEGATVPPAASCRGLRLCRRSAPGGRWARSARTRLAPGSLLPGGHQHRNFGAERRHFARLRRFSASCTPPRYNSAARDRNPVSFPVGGRRPWWGSHGKRSGTDPIRSRANGHSTAHGSPVRR